MESEHDVFSLWSGNNLLSQLASIFTSNYLFDLITMSCFLPVLVPGLPADGAVPHPGRLLRSDPPPLPQQRLALHPDEPLLLRGGNQRDPSLSLGLAQRRLHRRRGPGEVCKVCFHPRHVESVNAFPSVQLFLPRVLVMYLIAGAAFLFYVTKIPERYFPGESLPLSPGALKVCSPGVSFSRAPAGSALLTWACSLLPGQLNYLGASHQVWHILVVVMFYWWHQTAVHIMHFRHSRACTPRSSQSDQS